VNSNAVAFTELPLRADELLTALLNLAPSRGVQILDSGGWRGAEARYLIAGFDPCETVEARRGGDQLTIWRRGETVGRRERGDVLSLLDERLANYQVPGDGGSFALSAGACIASFSYDLARTFLRLRSTEPPASSPAEPAATLAFHDALVIHDYHTGATRVTGASTARIAETCDVLRETTAGGTRLVSPTPAPRATTTAAVSNFTRDEYLARVRRVKEHIFAGDIYQANLTQQFTCPLAPGDTAEEVFLRLRRQHPASFATFLRRGADTVISASPERFLRVAVEADGGRTIEAWPIKGTRPRGTNAADDARLRAELMESEKDQAENTMIVDLLRNDLGRVCRYGSVEVAELCALQEHPTLFHLVSRVRGQLRPAVTTGELLRATFPCGSITGAPKLRAMEIIDEMETAPRGLSMGAIGYFAFDGSLDLSVAIRTMVIRDGIACFNVGGGVVAESDPALEYDESLVKARALLRALRADDGQRTKDFG